MKSSVKIIVLLGLAVVIAILGQWLYHQSHSHRVARTEAAPKPNPATAPVPAAPLTKSTSVPAATGPATIPDWLKPVLAPGSGSSYTERVKILNARTTNLTPDEIKALYAYLLTPAHSDADSRSGENWLRNVMLDKLVEQPDPPAGLSQVLVSIYQDQEQDAVMRDYAVQHMDPAYDQASADEKTVLLQTLWDATAESDSSIAGTALLALNDLAQGNSEFDQNQIAQTALKLAENENCGELTRITAVQLCGQMAVSQAEPLILNLAQNAPSVPLQIAAIAALGNLGDSSTETFLEQIAAGDEDRLKPAAQTALKRLQQRLGI